MWEKNRMHDKFCIVDLDYIMHGFYNWTKAANYNRETLVMTVDRDLVRNFSLRNFEKSLAILFCKGVFKCL